MLGTGLGSVLLSQLMARRGRGPGLALGYLVVAIGAALGVVAMQGEHFALFVVAVFVMGVGNAANHLSRYAAADLYPPERRASGSARSCGPGRSAVLPARRCSIRPVDCRRRRVCHASAGPFVVAVVGGVLVASRDHHAASASTAAP